MGVELLCALFWKLIIPYASIIGGTKTAHYSNQQTHNSSCLWSPPYKVETIAAIEAKHRVVKASVPKVLVPVQGISKILLQHFEGVVSVGMFYSLPKQQLRETSLVAALTSDVSDIKAPTVFGYKCMYGNPITHSHCTCASYLLLRPATWHLVGESACPPTMIVLSLCVVLWKSYLAKRMGFPQAISTSRTQAYLHVHCNSSV